MGRQTLLANKVLIAYSPYCTHNTIGLFLGKEWGSLVIIMLGQESCERAEEATRQIGPGRFQPRSLQESYGLWITHSTQQTFRVCYFNPHPNLSICSSCFA